MQNLEKSPPTTSYGGEQDQPPLVKLVENILPLKEVQVKAHSPLFQIIFLVLA